MEGEKVVFIGGYLVIAALFSGFCNAKESCNRHGFVAIVFLGLIWPYLWIATLGEMIGKWWHEE